MPHTVEFYFDFPSPYSYLASTQIRAVAARAGADINYHPFQILAAMKRVGNRPTTIESPAKFKYANADVGRWAVRYGVPLQPNPHMKTIAWAELSRGAIVAKGQGRIADYTHAVFPAVWANAADLSDRAVLLKLLDGAGFDGAGLLRTAGEPEVQAELEASTAAAADRGVFGAPTFFVGEEMYFGNDRLEWVAAALESKAA